MTEAPAAPVDWAPAARLEILHRRARMLAGLRGFFAARGVLEVETPVLSGAAVPDPHIECLETEVASVGTCFLAPSPECAMKRLLAAGSGPIFQVSRVFRGGELGRLHNPEFTLLEWYRPGLDAAGLIDEVEALVRELAGVERWERLSYREALELHAGVDPFGTDVQGLRRACVAQGLSPAAAPTLEESGALDFLLSRAVQPRLPRGGVFVYDFPPSQAAMARIRPGSPPLAERFELYLDGIEVANGYHELADATEQRTRFEADLAERARRGRKRAPLDERFLAAMAAGLPDCAGVALGLDRLLMVAIGARHLSEVLAFPMDRA